MAVLVAAVGLPEAVEDSNRRLLKLVYFICIQANFVFRSVNLYCVVIFDP